MASVPLCFVFLAVLKTSDGFQFSSSYQGQTIYALSGSSVTFHWSISGDVGTVNWGIRTPNKNEITTLVSLDQSGMVPFTPPAPDTYIKRVNGTFNGDSVSGSANYILSGITKNDEREYGCQARSADYTATLFDTVKLVVVETPHITLSHNTNTSYNERSKVDIRCNATGSPEPDVMWTHNGHVLSSGSKTARLSFDAIRKDQAGIYICKANNSVGSKQKSLNLIVNYKPEGITLTTSASQNVAVQGDNVTLTCHVTAAQPPVSEYRFNLNASSKVINKLTNLNQHTIHGLQRARDYGEYRCEAGNRIGMGQSAAVLLNINVPAKISSLTPNVTVNEQEPIDLQCDASGYPVPTVTLSKDGGPSQSAGSGVIHIKSSTRRNTGTYICRANNGVGQADQKKTFVVVNYAATITRISSSVPKSWVGQTVRLTCVSDGVPTPTLSWFTPQGTKHNTVRARENTVDFTMKSTEDFGPYNCTADNGVFPVASKTVLINEIKAPGSPSITTTDEDIQATSLKVKWTAPSDDGGSPITAYRVVILQGSAEKENKNITDPNATSFEIGYLQKNTSYTVKVFARNYVFEGEAGQLVTETKFEGVPSAVKLKAKQNGVKITLTWEKPDGNGAAITKYSVYHRVANAKEWEDPIEITAGSKLEYVFEGNKGKEYEFVVTASNRYGESPKADIKYFKVSAESDEGASPGPPAGRIDTAVIAGAGAAGVLLILGLILFVVWWKRRKAYSDHGSSVADLRVPNPDDFDDGYHTVGAASAARQLQASGPAGDVTYAQVDMSKKKDRRPVTDMYAEVDKSKKSKKKPKKPGELDYAELDDLRPNFRPAPQPSGAAAKPIVRAPAYEGTVYADIAQFGIPQPEPTYDNLPKKDVVYSNVESM